MLLISGFLIGGLFWLIAEATRFLLTIYLGIPAVILGIIAIVLMKVKKEKRIGFKCAIFGIISGALHIALMVFQILFTYSFV